jgi:PKD repeat protein
VGTTLQLAAVNSIEYAEYRFVVAGGNADSLSIELEQPQTTGVFLGLANRSTQQWEFSGPYTRQKTLSVDDPRYLAADHSIWLAVIAAPGSTGIVDALSIRTLRPGNQPPTASFQLDHASGPAPLTVQFDATGSSDPEAALIEYAWDWDGDGVYDGISDVGQVSHVFGTPGQYNVKLRVTDDQFAHATAEHLITVWGPNNTPPLAFFTGAPASGVAPLSVALDASASLDQDGSIVRYDWDFDNDGLWEGYDAGPQLTHVFTVPGTYAVRLRVTDNGGAQGTYQDSIQVNTNGNLAPTAAFTATPQTGSAPLQVNLTLPAPATVMAASCATTGISTATAAGMASTPARHRSISSVRPACTVSACG